jgi:hypothetical protein
MNAANRHRWTRTVAAGVLGATLLAAGCAGPDTHDRPSASFGNKAREEAIRQKARSDSFPAAHQAESSRGTVQQ